jgi:hypothetical protein
MVNTFHLHNSGNSMDICEFTFNFAIFFVALQIR